ncbi:MAG: GFA family protein [Yoonia sp.]|nr:GFA family protein [Yoonia sp.]
MAQASCNCGAVSVKVTADLVAPNACHCSRCRKQSGHYWASVEAPKRAVTVTGAENVTWYQASPKVRRGFCKTCGCFLFFDPLFQDWTAIAMGAFDGPTHAHLALHIFTDDKGDYYEITDGLPQNGQ